MISAGGRSLGRGSDQGRACLVAARWALVIVVTVRRGKLVREVKPGDRAQPRGTRRMPDGGARATRDREHAARKTEPLTGSGPRRRCLPGVLPGGLGLPGCPTMPKLRNDFAPEKTPPHRLGSAHRRLRHCRGDGRQSDTDGERGTNQGSERHTGTVPCTGASARYQRSSQQWPGGFVFSSKGRTRL